MEPYVPGMLKLLSLFCVCVWVSIQTLYIYSFTHKILTTIVVIDEIKWQLRFPTKFAMSTLKLTYLDKVEQETHNFLSERVKHNLLNPEKGLNLDLTIKEAEILMSANENVRDLADKGELQKIHKKYNDL